MPNTLRALVLDDDQDAADWLTCLLKARFPSLPVETRLSPNVAGDFDLYFIDNDFHGTCLAGDLAVAIRAVNPRGLIVAFSARLDNETLKRLLNAGCDGACDKSDSHDISQLLEIVAAYISRCQSETRPRGFLEAVRSIRDLLREWNRRLETNPWQGKSAGTTLWTQSVLADAISAGCATN